MPDLPSDTRRHWVATATLAFAAVVLTVLQGGINSEYLRLYSGGLDPFAAAVVVAIAGVVLLAVLRKFAGFVLYKPGNRRGLQVAAGFAVLFGIIVVPADFIIAYPADINVPYPGSLLFYPVIAFFAEVLFHLLPLTLLLLVLAPLSAHIGRERMVWVAITLTALVEPVYQSQWMAAQGGMPPWAVGFTLLHIFAINLAQLVLFRRFDFVTMMSLRLGYYFLWHIVWGALRLNVLY